MNAQRRIKVLVAIGGTALVMAAAGFEGRAEACGCFAPPDPSVPIVQAGERIVFAMEDGNVVAHVQIQYAGKDGTDFGWLLPLPAVPVMAVGTDEIFNQLINTTQPKYRLTRVYEGNCSFDPSRFGRGGFGGPQAAGGDANSPPSESTGKGSPLVIQDSVGPYDYAVLRADDKTEMLNWLTQNRYFIPAGTDATVGPYIRPGAYFLALKLRAGNQAGDIVPVVLKYKSDLPMIPIILTSVAANPDMGIQVWMLGKGRAIPRNYYHTVINDSKINWLTSGANYNDVIIAATHEADGRHTFVTEYAGTAGVMKNVLNPAGRFGSQTELASMPSEIEFVSYLWSHGFGVANPGQQQGGPIGPGGQFGQSFTSTLKGILGKYVPVPPALVAKNVSADQFYQNLSYYLGSYRLQNPGDFSGYTVNYVPTMMAQEIFDAVVKPTLEAGKLFDNHQYLTRLYTTLSPEDMNKDPVFSYNVGLRDVNNTHEASLTYHCGFFGRSNQATTPASLLTEQGWKMSFPYGTGQNNDWTQPGGPSSVRIEILAEEGEPQVVVDNTDTIGSIVGSKAGGCGVTVGSRATETAGGLLVLLGAALALVLRRKRA
jgi:MYXO-CTERM domain-containing protein